MNKMKTKTEPPDKEFVEGPEARKNFENTMSRLFKAPKQEKHTPKRRVKKGKD
jgi:hypothetical protein